MSRDSRRRRARPDPGSEDKRWASYSERFRREVMPKLLSSAVCMAVWDGGDITREVQFATELGMMIIYDKPIILTHRPGHPPPERLRRVADEVIELDPDDPLSQDHFANVLARYGPQPEE